MRAQSARASWARRAGTPRARHSRACVLTRVLLLVPLGCPLAACLPAPRSLFLPLFLPLSPCARRHAASSRAPAPAASRCASSTRP
jgi:hypothetical protein